MELHKILHTIMRTIPTKISLNPVTRYKFHEVYVTYSMRTKVNLLMPRDNSETGR